MAHTNEDILEKIAELKGEIIERDERLADKIDRTYLRIAVFESEIRPIRKFVYGLITIAGAALITALLGLVLR